MVGHLCTPTQAPTLHIPQLEPPLGLHPLGAKGAMAIPGVVRNWGQGLAWHGRCPPWA